MARLANALPPAAGPRAHGTDALDDEHTVRESARGVVGLDAPAGRFGIDVTTERGSRHVPGSYAVRGEAVDHATHCRRRERRTLARRHRLSHREARYVGVFATRL
jgi:hypothetical protein